MMITVGIIGVLAAVGLPAYQGYIETANMGKVNEAYQHAITTVQREFSKDTTRAALGLPSTIPLDEAAWVVVLDPREQSVAPGGGRIYLVDSESNPDPNVTGAVTVKFDTETGEVQIHRPSYKSLVAYTARITRNSVDITKDT